jgi:hypothetical protein
MVISMREFIFFFKKTLSSFTGLLRIVVDVIWIVVIWLMHHIPFLHLILVAWITDYCLTMSGRRYRLLIRHLEIICHYNFCCFKICHYNSWNWIYVIVVQPNAKIEWQIFNIAPNCNGKFPYHFELQWQVSACGWIAMANFQLGDF